MQDQKEMVNYLEKLGAYNPNTNPATIELNVDGTVQWLTEWCTTNGHCQSHFILQRRNA